MAHQQLTRIKPHVREGHAVKGYEAKRFKGVEDEGVGSFERVSENTFQDEHSKIEKELYDADGNIKAGTTPEQMETSVKKLLCLSDECGVDPVIFSQKGFLRNVYDNQSNVIEESIPTASAYHATALDSILDKENLQTIIKSVDSLEKIFSKELGAKTERIDPFTFKFKSEQKIGLDNEELYDAMGRYVEARMGKLASQFGDAFSGVDMRKAEKDVINGVDDHISNPNFGKSVGSSIILSSIHSPNQNNTIPMDSWNGFLDFLDSKGFQDSFDMGYSHHDPDKLQNLLTKELRNSPDFEGRDQISKFFKSLETGSVVPAFNYMMNTSSLPTFLLGNQSLMKEIKKTVDGIKQIYDVQKASDAEIHVSRNPLNILTMSPDKHAPSCQSLIKDGEMNITNMNVNVPASYLAFATNDFVMYTLNKEGQKDARMAMSFDPSSRKFVNYENNSIYGSSNVNKAVLGEYVNGKDMFAQKQYEMVTEEDVRDMNSFITLDKLSKALADHDSWFQSNIEEDNIEGAENDYNEFKKSHDLWKKNKELVYKGFLGDMDDRFLEILSEEKSMLYDSKLMSFTSGSKAISDIFQKKQKTVDEMYEGLEITMSYDLDQSKKKSA